MERRYRETDSAWIREEFERYQNNRPCGACGGYRLRPEALAVKIAGLHVGQVVQMSIREAYAWCEACPPAEPAEERDRPRDPEGNPRAAGLSEQCRPGIPDAVAQSGTLSGGEASASGWPRQIGSGLTGVLYVLDEPSIGLHQRDNDRLLKR
jgi:excinuclease ABC subunit A